MFPTEKLSTRVLRGNVKWTLIFMLKHLFRKLIVYQMNPPKLSNILMGTLSKYSLENITKIMYHLSVVG